MSHCSRRNLHTRNECIRQTCTLATPFVVSEFAVCMSHRSSWDKLLTPGSSVLCVSGSSCVGHLCASALGSDVQGGHIPMLSLVQFRIGSFTALGNELLECLHDRFLLHPLVHDMSSLLRTLNSSSPVSGLVAAIARGHVVQFLSGGGHL